MDIKQLKVNYQKMAETLKILKKMDNPSTEEVRKSLLTNIPANYIHNGNIILDPRQCQIIVVTTGKRLLLTIERIILFWSP